MNTESPFREEDRQARVDALRAERDGLARTLAAIREQVKETDRQRWSWWSFALGFCVVPAAALLLIGWMAMSEESSSTTRSLHDWGGPPHGQ